MLQMLQRLVVFLLLASTSLTSFGALYTTDAYVGQSATLSATCNGTAPFTYQWYKNDTPITNAIAASYAINSLQLTDSGNYTVVVSNSSGSAKSAVYTITVNSQAIAPTISIQPAGSAVTSGDAASFSVTVAGTAPLSYQWYKDGLTLAGATSASLTLSSSSTSDAGSYTVTISNSAGSVTSTAATLKITAATVAPSITTQPASLTVTAGQNASFSVAASGTAPFTYQWYKDGAALSGATSSNLSLSSVSSTDAAAYSVKVSNTTGSVVSSAAALTVTAIVTAKNTSAPTIDIQPLPLNVVAGKGASFSVSVSGTAPFAYQWYKDNSALSGATSSSLSIASVASTDAGSYTVKVSNSAGSVTSTSAALTVTAAPTAPVIKTQPVSLTVAPVQPATFSVEATGSGTLTYQWYKASAPISGATASSYSIPACTAADASTYTVTVFNSVGSVTSKGASLVIDTTLTKPVITSQPTGLTVAVARKATFTVKATSSTTPLYQWKKDGIAISGANTDTLTIQKSQLADAGSYSVVVTNGAGSVASSAAILTVVQPVSDVITSRISNMSVRSVYDAASGPMIIGFNVTGGAKDMLIRAIGPGLGLFGVTGILTDPTLTLYSGSTEIGANDNWADAGLSAALSDAFQAVGAFGLSDTSSKDAAMLATVDGSRTVHVKSPEASANGVVLLEVYDTGSGTSQRLNNLSIMNTAGSGSKCLIVGFTIDGTGTKRVLIRGVGPGLAPFGVTGVLADPKLELHGTVNGVDTVLASNDNWQDDPAAAAAFATAGAFSLPDASKDTALVIELPAGSYTAMLSGPGTATGTALVEVYELP
jgi:hypothetical protein